MVCQRCQSSFTPESAFCQNCGAPVQARARHLGWVFFLAWLILLPVLGYGGLSAYRQRYRGAVSNPTPSLPDTPGRDSPGPETPVPSPQSPSPSPSSRAEPESGRPLSEMELQLREYYQWINDKKLQQAYRSRTQASRQRTSLAEFEKTWSNNRSLSLESFQLKLQSGSQAVVQVRLKADDLDAAGHSEVLVYRGEVKLVQEGGRWCYDGGDFQPEWDPQQVVGRFYAWLQSHPGDRWSAWSQVEPWMQSSLRNQLAAARSQLQSDPFSDATEGIRSYVTQRAQQDSSGANVRVDLTLDSGQTRSLTIELRHDGLDWKISDFLYDEGRRRLSQHLTELASP